jgi:hypothetical protein
MPHSTSDPTADPHQQAIDARQGGPVTPLQLDRWTLHVRGDEVADIAFAGVSLLRAIRPVIRDRDWNTVPVRVLEVEHSFSSVTTKLSFDDGEIQFDGTLRLTVTAERLTVDFDAFAVRECETNRAGLVVLHRADDAGTSVAVTHTDGSVEQGTWPVDISPHQPFRDVAGFRWTRACVEATLSLSGEVFETEDQRNWTDASFKTYSTPLTKPFPVLNPAGTTVHQTARLDATARPIRASQPPRGHPDAVTVTDTVIGHVPPISLGAALYPPAKAPTGRPAEYEAVLVELAGAEQRWPDLLTAAGEQAASLGCGLDIRIITDRPESVERLGMSLPAQAIRVGVFDPVSHISTEPLWRTLCSSTAAAGLTARLVGGTRAHFAELNRRIDDIPADVGDLTFSLTPQMHAREIPHIIDSLDTQRTVATNAVRLANGRPVHVGPITLARRFNAVATTGPGDPQTDAERATDPLLNTGFAAAWTLSSVSALSQAGITSLCYFETAGPRGITHDAVRKPVGKLLDRLAQLRNQPILQIETLGGIAALAVLNDRGVIELAIADLSGRPRTVQIRHSGHHSQAVELTAWGISHLTVGG